MHSAAIVSDELPKEASTERRAGANITPDKGLQRRLDFIIEKGGKGEGEKYERIVIAVRITTMEDFAFVVQLRGLSESSDESHPTTLEGVSDGTIVTAAAFKPFSRG